MNLTYFRPEMRGNLKKNISVNIRFVAKTSDIRNLSENITSDVMWKYQKWQFWCCLEVAATELHLCFVIKGIVWWKCTFLPMTTIVVLHHKHMKLVKPLNTCDCVVRQKRLSVDSSNERAENEIAMFG